MSVSRPIVFILSLLTIFFLTAFLADGQHNPDSQRFTATQFPIPPDQMVQWKSPAGVDQLPVKLISATSKLFEQGLADPRHCVYREIQVIVGNVWGGAGAIITHGWVTKTACN